MEEPELIYCEVKDTGKEVQPLPPPLPKREYIPALYIEVNPPRRIPPPQTLTVITNRCKRCSRNSTSRKQVILAIAVGILAILSTVFVATYFTTVGKGKPCDCQNSLANKENTSCNNVKKKHCVSKNCSLVINCSESNISTTTMLIGNNTDNTTLERDVGEKQCLEKSMLFHRKSISDYAISPGAPDDMMAITACLWVKIRETPDEQTFVSYAVTGRHNELLIAVHLDVLAFHFKGSVLERSNVITQDGDWHAICCVWSSKIGHYKLYKDGKLAVERSDRRRGEKISGGGTWVLGHDQDKVGGGFKVNQMVEGEMTEVNIWDKELSSKEILEFSTTCQSKLQGNVKSWNDFMAGVKGDVKIVDRPACCTPKV